jgi:hypothetical protein
MTKFEILLFFILYNFTELLYNHNLTKKFKTIAHYS